MKEKLAKEISEIIYEKRTLESDINQLNNTDDWFLVLSFKSFANGNETILKAQQDKNIKDAIKKLIIQETKKKIEILNERLEKI